jgi:hypothetical protein
LEPGSVILVGHSRGGLIIRQVAERRPDKIATLVYLTAMLVKDGEAGLPTLGALGHTPLLDYITASADGTTLTVRDEGIHPSFYGRCNEEDVALAKQLLRPEPTEPSTTPIRVSEENFGRVPRIYIECQQDNAILPPKKKRCTRQRRVGRSFRWIRITRRSSRRPQNSLVISSIFPLRLLVDSRLATFSANQVAGSDDAWGRSSMHRSIRARACWTLSFSLVLIRKLQ